MSPYVPTALIRAQSDERLARLAALGSERAFESIVERYRRPLLLYARRMVGESRAEDVVQASFVAAWTDLRRGTEIREVRAWLYRVVHNRSLNVLKRSDNSEVPLIDAVRASGPGVAAEVEDRDAIRETLREIADLPERQRVALLAVAVDGRRHRDVGIELGLSEGAVKMLVSRARGTLRAAAGAFVPFPLLVRLAGLGGSGAGSTAGGVSLLGASALKAGAVLATAGALATAGPPAIHALVKPAAPVLSTGAVASSSALSRHAAPAPIGAAAPGLNLVSSGDGSEPLPGGLPSAAALSIVADAPTTTTPDVAEAPSDPSAPAAPAVERQNSVSTAHSRDFLTRASAPFIDDDLIVVPEDPNAYDHGETAIPADGVPDAVANAITDEAPDPGNDPPEPDAPAASTAAPAGAATVPNSVPDAGPASTPAADSAPAAPPAP